MSERTSNVVDEGEAWAREIEALRSGAALVELVQPDWLVFSGADRLRFVNGLVTCKVDGLEPGHGVYGFFLDTKGKILADAVLLATQDELWIELPPGRGPEIAEHAGRYIVADQVEVRTEEGRQATLLAGPEADARARAALGELPEAGSWNGGECGSIASLVIRSERRLGVPAWLLVGPQAVVAGAKAALREVGVLAVGARAADSVRVESGIPRCGVDFAAGGPGEFPQETGLEGWTVNYEKGCYLGQEVVARIHFRGKVNRRLSGVRFAAAELPAVPSDLTLEGEVVGRLTSLAPSLCFPEAIGLAIVHRKAEVGSELRAGACVCRLVELPFGP